MEHDMPNRLDPAWWAIILTVLGGVLGWWWRGAQNAARLDVVIRDLERISERVKSLETGSVTTAAALASIAAQIEGIGRTLSRLERKLDGKQDK